MNLKERVMVLHVISAALTLVSIFIFIQSQKYSWVVISFPIFFIISGMAILAIYRRKLSPFQKLYFELVFAIPFLIVAFWVGIKLFEYLFFG
jgi:hypothetical protein